LYLLLWANLANSEAPVSTGRGASALADYDAGKTLTIPDFRGRALIGAGTGSGLTARTIGTKGGAETHVLASGEIPAHSHPVKYSNQTYTSGAGTMVGTLGTGGLSADTDNNAGGGSAHNNMQPWGAVNFMVKL
jgi:microcystin-dependent protein